MSFSVSNLFQVLGKYIKSVNIYDADLTDLETFKTDIRTVMQSQGYLDNYDDLPSITTSEQSNLSSYIATLIASSQEPFLDETKVLRELRLSAFNFNSVLDGIYDHFTENTDAVQASVVSIDGSNQHYADIDISSSGGGSDVSDGPKVFVTRYLDGTNAPSDAIPANQRYNNVESGLARSTTLYFETTSTTAAGSEQVLIYPTGPLTVPYTYGDEEPSIGPTLSNAHGSSLVPSNWDFTDWTSDDPDDWTMGTGSASTDWEDSSGTGIGPLSFITKGASCSQLVTGLSHKQMYFIGVYWASRGTTDNNIKVTLKPTTGSDIHTFTRTAVIDSSDYAYAFDFYSLPTSVDLTDVNLKIEYLDEGNAANNILVAKAMIAPVTYYNGLGFVFWNGGSALDDSPGVDTVVEADWGSMVVSNDDYGVFQTFLRKAYNYQLPMQGTPTVTESWAT